MLIGYMRVSKADGSQSTDLQLYEDRAHGGAAAGIAPWPWASDCAVM
jgi:hypothetical protein